MRRTICLALLVALGLVAAGASSATTADEGTLSVKRGDGFFMLSMRGVAIGRLGDGILIVEIPTSRSCDDLKVWGEAESGTLFQIIDGEPTFVCGFSGSKIRFRLSNKIEVTVSDAQNLFLSAAGRGKVLVDGRGGRKDGVMSINGRPDRSLPDKLTPFVIEPDTAAYSALTAP